jgi:endonuclease-3 related protein
VIAVKKKKSLLEIYERLYRHFGPQHWWPAESSFEVMIGAFLTQNTSWNNVAKAIVNLKNEKALSFRKMARLNTGELSRLIRPAGYHNIKARRIKNFLRYLERVYGGRIARMRLKDTVSLREELLSVNGIGPETADSILLYALDKPVFVVDAYTRRVFGRHRWLKGPEDYQSVQSLFNAHLAPDVKLFNEYHALIVKLAKDFCKKTKPRCASCPLHEKN